MFWDYRTQDWETEGCRYVGETSDGMVQCECNHLTNFAILMVSAHYGSDEGIHEQFRKLFKGLDKGTESIQNVIFSYPCGLQYFTG